MIPEMIANSPLTMDEAVGIVLVAGQDTYGHNKFRSTDNRGRPFPHHTVAVAAT